MNEHIYTFKDGRQTIFDDIDKPIICQFNLQITPKGYVVMQMSTGGKYVKHLLHRYIIDAPKGMLVDHINRDVRDNRRCNLRLVNDSQNMRNCKKRQLKTAASKHKGINLAGNNWQARIMTDNGRLYLGTFKNEIDAALAYNEAAIKYHGEYANLNII